MDAQPFAETQQFFVKQRCAKGVAATASSHCFPRSLPVYSKHPAPRFPDLPESPGSLELGCFAWRTKLIKCSNSWRPSKQSPSLDTSERHSGHH
jgi:hypothetical protein